MRVRFNDIKINYLKIIGPKDSDADSFQRVLDISSQNIFTQLDKVDIKSKQKSNIICLIFKVNIKLNLIINYHNISFIFIFLL
jgi:hypothetical protein